MAVKTEVARKIVGKVIRDSYDQVYGRILGVSSGPQATVPYVLIERSNGDISNCPSSEILVAGDSLVLNTSWTGKANRLSEDVSIILQKISALNKLYKNGEVVKNVYEKIQEQYETVIQSLLEHRQRLSKNAKDRLEALSSRVDHLGVFLVNVKLDRSIKYVDEEAYKATSEALQELLARTLSEKNEVQAALTELTEDATPPETATSLEGKREDASIQPLALHGNEAGL